jgi:hypothetical protein
MANYTLPGMRSVRHHGNILLHSWDTCPKVGHKSKAKARKALKSTISCKQVYKCIHCGLWHTSSMSKAQYEGS